MGKYYAFLGEESKIFTDWAECSEYMSGKKGYKYKSFRTLEEAEAFLNGENYYDDAIAEDVKNGYAVAYTDGSFSEVTSNYSYGVIAISPTNEKSEFSGVGNTEEFLSTRNIAGEVLGVLTAAKWAFINGYKKLKIYHDYVGLSEWAERRWAAKSPISFYYVGRLFRYTTAVDIEFVKVKGHSNNKYNEEVDKIAKAALTGEKILPLTPLNSGFSFRTEDFDGYVKKLYREAMKAKAEDSYNGISLSFGEDMCTVSAMNNNVLSVGGNGGALYALAAMSAIEFLNFDKRQAERIISVAFDVNFEFSGGYSGVEISEKLIESGFDKNCAFAIIFALKDIEIKLKAELNTDKISECFIYDGDDIFFKGEKGDKKLLGAYKLFYKYRVPFLSLDKAKDEAAAILLKIKEFLL